MLKHKAKFLILSAVFVFHLNLDAGIMIIFLSVTCLKSSVKIFLLIYQIIILTNLFLF